MRSRSSIQVSALLRSCFEVRTLTSMAKGTRAYRRIGTRDPAAQRLARTLAQTEQVLTDGRRDRLLFHNLWGGRWARVFGGGGCEPSEQRSTPARALCERAWRPSTGATRALVRRDGGGRRLATAWTLGSGETCEWWLGKRRQRKQQAPATGQLACAC